MPTSTPHPKCRCAKSPSVVLGSPSKLPCKDKTLIDSKPHPICEAPYASISLFRCNACGQHWQADGMQGRVRTGTSWPQVCIKIDTPAGWTRFDDRSLRGQHFPEFDRGLDPDRTCSTTGCTDFPVRGLPYCNTCTLDLRQKGVEVLSA